MLSRLVVGVLCVQAVAVLATGKPTSVDKLLDEWKIDVSELSSSIQSNTCLATVETLQNFNARQFTGCKDVKNLCSACSSCSKFTSLSQADPTKKACVCAVASDATTTGKLGQKDDCFITPFGVDFTGALTLDLSGGDDCAIVVGATQTNAVTINGGAGDDVLISLDDKRLATSAGVITLNGGVGNDCIYLGDDAQVANGDNGDDVIVLDTASGGLMVDVNGGGGDDLIFAFGELSYNAGAEIHGDAGNDKIFLGGNANKLVNGDAGSDKIIVLSDAVVLGDVYGGDGNDYIVVAEQGYAQKLSADDGDDIIQINGAVGIVYGGDGSDNITVASSARVIQEVYIGDGDNYVHVAGFVYAIYGDMAGVYGNNLIVLSDKAVVAYDVDLYGGDDVVVVGHDAVVGDSVYAGYGANKVYVYGFVAHYVEGQGDADYVFVASTGVVGDIDVNGGDDNVVIEGLVQEDLYLGEGNNHLQLTKTARVFYVYGGPDDDYFSIGSSADVVVDLIAYDGDNQFSVSGEVRGPIRAGADDDIFNLKSSAKVGSIFDVGGYNIIYLSENSNIEAPLDLGGVNDVCYVPEGFENVNDQCDELHFISSSSSS